MVANTVIDVILAEAVHGTRAERYADMLGIASVIANRAALSGRDALSIVSAQRGKDKQFDAYGKSLPKGANAYRDLAEQAWNHVQTKGPVHNGTYYATPKAKDGLPSGLTPVTKTTGHEFFADPQGRSFLTAQGYVTPSRGAVAAMLSGNLQAITNPYAEVVPPTPVQLASISIPSTMPAPPSRPGAVPALPAPPAGALPSVSYNLSGKQRAGMPDPGVISAAQLAVRDVLGPQATIAVNSGVGRHGSNRHGTGFAADIQVFDARGNLVSPATTPDLAKQLGTAFAMRGFTGLGFGTDYMGGRSFHVDRVEAEKPGFLNPATQDNEWGNFGNAMKADLAQARANGRFAETVAREGLPPNRPGRDLPAPVDPHRASLPSAPVERSSLAPARSAHEQAIVDSHQQHAQSRMAAPTTPVGSLPAPSMPDTMAAPPSRPGATPVSLPAAPGPLSAAPVGAVERAPLSPVLADPMPQSMPAPPSRPSSIVSLPETMMAPPSRPSTPAPLAPAPVGVVERSALAPAMPQTMPAPPSRPSATLTVPGSIMAPPSGLKAPSLNPSVPARSVQTTAVPLGSMGSFPPAPKDPTRANIGGMIGGAAKGFLAGGPIGAIVGAISAPAKAQIARNMEHNRNFPNNKVNVFTGIGAQYRSMLGAIPGIGSISLSNLPAPDRSTPGFSVGSGFGAIGSVFGGPAGATATSRSNPEVSFRSLGNGYVERSNSRYGTTAIMSPGSYNPGTRGVAPIGGQIAAAMAAQKDRDGRNGQNNRAGVNPNSMAGQFGGFGGFGMASPFGFGGVGFPAAPAVPNGYVGYGSAGGPSYSDMAAISPAAADAIAGGGGGLY